MLKKIKITAGKVEMQAELNDSQTAGTIYDALPIKAKANTWGDEIYFAIPVSCDEEDAKEIVDLGTIAYWFPGKAFCIFFGRTPASQGDEIRPASAVNILGKIIGDPTVFKKVKSGTLVVIEKVM
ncbi:MAG: cyclophilin-like fold protein [Elusimicrobia bacterium]|nr:cyclophilin-like fold protein [Elusimicrobiota bacterium]